MPTPPDGKLIAFVGPGAGGSTIVNPNFKRPNPGGAVRTINRTMGTVAGESTSVAFFGVLGDGYTNDLTTFQEACDTMAVNGGWLRVPAGFRVYLPGVVNIPSFLRLIGDGESFSRLSFVPAPWQASYGFVLNMELLDPNNHIQKCTTAGTSGTVIPSVWDVSGGTTADGTAVWTDQGLSTGTAGLATGSGWFDLNGVSNVDLIGCSMEGGVLTPKAVQYGLAAGSGGDPNDNVWTQGTCVWIKTGSSHINIWDWDLHHPGGHGIYFYDDVAYLDIDNLGVYNSRAAVMKVAGGNADYASWNGCIFGGYDGTTNAVFTDITIRAFFQNVTGHCFWTRGSALTPHKMNRNVVVFVECEDHLGDATEPGDIDTYTEDVISRRGGMICTNGATTGFTTPGVLVDWTPTGTRVPKWLNQFDSTLGAFRNVAAAILDTTGRLFNYTRRFDVDGFNGGLGSGDGCSYGVWSGQGTSAFLSTDALINTSLCGPDGSLGTNYTSGITLDNSSLQTDVGWSNIIDGCVINGCGYASIGFYANRQGSISNTVVNQPVVSGQTAPVIFGNIGTSNHLRSFSNKAVGLHIEWPVSGGAAIAEDDGGGAFPFVSTDINIVDSTNTTTAGALFLKNNNSSSTSGKLLLSSVSVQAQGLVGTFLQTQGVIAAPSLTDHAFVGYRSDGVLLFQSTINTFLTPSLSVLLNAWIAAHSYTVGTEILDSNGLVQIVTVAGTSGGSHPGWSITTGNITVDGGGTLRWMCLGSPVTSDAQRNHYANSYSIVSPVNSAVNSIVIDGATNGFLRSLAITTITPNDLISNVPTGTHVIDSQAGTPIHTSEGHGITWQGNSGGYIWGVENTAAATANANGLLVKVANPSAVTRVLTLNVGGSDLVTVNGVGTLTAQAYAVGSIGVVFNDRSVYGTSYSIQPAPFVPSGAYTVGQEIYDGTNIQVVTVAGTASTTPTWNVTVGGTTTTGGVTFKNRGLGLAIGFDKTGYLSQLYINTPTGPLQVIDNNGNYLGGFSPTPPIVFGSPTYTGSYVLSVASHGAFDNLNDYSPIVAMLNPGTATIRDLTDYVQPYVAGHTVGSREGALNAGAVNLVGSTNWECDGVRSVVVNLNSPTPLPGFSGVYTGCTVVAGSFFACNVAAPVAGNLGAAFGFNTLLADYNAKVGPSTNQPSYLLHHEMDTHTANAGSIIRGITANVTWTGSGGVPTNPNWTAFEIDNPSGAPFLYGFISQVGAATIGLQLMNGPSSSNSQYIQLVSGSSLNSRIYADVGGNIVFAPNIGSNSNTIGIGSTGGLLVNGSGVLTSARDFTGHSYALDSAGYAQTNAGTLGLVFAASGDCYANSFTLHSAFANMLVIDNTATGTLAQLKMSDGTHTQVAIGPVNSLGYSNCNFALGTFVGIQVGSNSGITGGAPGGWVNVATGFMINGTAITGATGSLSTGNIFCSTLTVTTFSPTSIAVAGSAGTPGISLAAGYMQSAEGFFSTSYLANALNLQNGGAAIGGCVNIANTAPVIDVGAKVEIRGQSFPGYAFHTAYFAGQRIVVNISGTNYVQVANAAGTSGSSTPSFSTTTGGAALDSSFGFLWICQGPYNGNAYYVASDSTGAVRGYFGVTGGGAFMGTFTAHSFGVRTANVDRIVITGVLGPNVGGTFLPVGAVGIDMTPSTQFNLAGSSLFTNPILQVNGSVYANGGLECGSQGIGCGGITIFGGNTGQSYTLTFGGGFGITGFGGTFHNLFFKGGVLVAAT